MRVIMVLMNGHHHRGSIHDSSPHMAGLPDKPVVKPRSPERKRRQLLIQATWKHKVVDRIWSSRLPPLPYQSVKVLLPHRSVDGERLCKVHIPTLSHHKEALCPLAYLPHGAYEVASQYDVTADIAE
jgi:hypothetical protein